MKRSTFITLYTAVLVALFAVVWYVSTPTDYTNVVEKAQHHAEHCIKGRKIHMVARQHQHGLLIECRHQKLFVPREIIFSDDQMPTLKDAYDWEYTQFTGGKL